MENDASSQRLIAQILVVFALLIWILQFPAFIDFPLLV